MAAIQRDLNLLVIEDNPGDFVLIEEYLAEIGDSVRTQHAKTYKEAKSVLEGHTNFDAILLDLTLPDVSGETLVEKIVELAGQIPVIVLTGYENQEFGLKTLSMGVADYVLKDEITPFMLGKIITYGIERNRIRQSLHKSEKKYRDIFDLSPQPMYLVDMESRHIVDANEAALKQYGYKKEEFVGLHLYDIRPDEHRSRLDHEIQKAESHTDHFYETILTHQKKNGESFKAKINTSKIYQDGIPYRMVLAEDVTEKIKAEYEIQQKSQLLAANAKVTGALIKNENWLQALSETFDLVGKAVEVDRVYFFETHTDPETKEQLISQRIEWSKEDVEAQIDNSELQNIRISEYKEHFPKLQANEIFQSLVKDIQEQKLKAMLEDQDIISILHIPVSVDGKFHGFIGFDDCHNERIWDDEEIAYLQTLATNISNAIKLRQTTNELQASEYKFKSMVEEGGDLIEILDEKGNFKFISPNLEKILGWSPENIIGKNAFDFIHPDDVKAARRDFHNIVNEKHVDAQPFRFKNKNGTWDWLKTSATNLLNDDVMKGILVTASDITEQKYYNELQRLERDVLESDALNEKGIKTISHEFLTGIEKLHSGIRTSVTLVKDGKLYNFCSPSLPEACMEQIEKTPISDKAGSCGTAAYRKEQVIVTNIFEDPLWEDFRHLGKTYDFTACWSVPIFNSKGEVIATFAVYYDEPAEPSKFEQNTVERAAHIFRILFESEEKEKAEQELAFREKRFKALVQEGSDLIGILDEDLKFKYVSPSAGKEYQNYVGENAFGFIHPEDQEIVAENLEMLDQEKRIVLSPYRLRGFDGRYYWVETIVTNLLDDPAVQGIVANSRNITRQIQREEKLRELSLVASKTTDAVIITDEKGMITWVNNAFEKLTGYRLDEIKGRKPGHFLQGPDTNQKTIQEISKAIKAEESIEATILNYNKKGQEYWLNMSIDPIFDEDGKCTHFIAIERNVTEKIQRDKQLQESLERYDIVNKATSDTIWDFDIQIDQMVYNDNIHSMFGYEKKDVKNVGNWWREKIHPDDIESVDKALSEVLKNDNDRFQMEYRFKAANGSYKYIFDRAFVIKDETGTPVRMIGAMQDITQEREEEERLKLLESVITNTSESVVILNAKPGKFGREIIFVNEAFTELTGYSANEVMGETLHFLNGPETDQDIRKDLRNAMDHFQAIEVEFINYTKEGEKFWINTSMVPVQNKEGEYTHWVAIGRDITEQKQNEEAIKSSLQEKETLLAEIHHRVKNNLAVVSGMMQLQAFESDNEELQDKLYDSVVRIKTMATVHELLYQSNSFSQLEFSETLKKLVQNISETLQTNTKVQLNIDCEPIKLNINQAIPASLIVNEVITNAYKHAFPESTDGEVNFTLSENEGLINIEIKDNGCGFPDDEIMESGSLGIHLINVLGEQLNGSLEYKNHDIGTVFTLEFERQELKKGIGNAGLN